MKAPAVTDPQYTIDKLRGAITLMAKSRNLWKRRATERTTVGHSLWNLRTPYPTAIDCRCGQRLYRFGTELRHRDATRCYPDGRDSCSWPDDCPTADECARGCVASTRTVP